MPADDARTDHVGEVDRAGGLEVAEDDFLVEVDVYSWTDACAKAVFRWEDRWRERYERHDGVIRFLACATGSSRVLGPLRL